MQPVVTIRLKIYATSTHRKRKQNTNTNKDSHNYKVIREIDKTNYIHCTELSYTLIGKLYETNQTDANRETGI